MKKENLLLDLLGLASVVGFGFASYQLFKLYRGDKAVKENKSSISGLKTMTFTLTNNTNQNQVQYLFDSLSGKTNSNVGVQPSMNFFNNELSNKPKKLMKIEFRALGNSSFSNIDTGGTGDITIGGGGVSTPIVIPPPTPPTPPIVDPIAPPTPPAQNQAEAPFKMTCADANGNSSMQQYTPLISANQYQGGITSVDFNGKILDGQCYMEYTMFPKSKVAIVLYYEDMALSSLLDKDKKKDKSEVESKPMSEAKKNNNATSSKLPLKTLGSIAVVGTAGYLAFKYLGK